MKPAPTFGQLVERIQTAHHELAIQAGRAVNISLTLRKQLRKNGAILAKVNAERLRAVQESLGGVREVLLDNTQPFFVETFAKLDREAANAQSMVTFSSSSPWATNRRPSSLGAQVMLEFSS